MAYIDKSLTFSWKGRIIILLANKEAIGGGLAPPTTLYFHSSQGNIRGPKYMDFKRK
jgi:hypothetical protein